MGNTKKGGKKFVQTMINKYGSYEKWIDQMRINGSKGGSKNGTGGFASDKVGNDGLTGRERAVIAGRKGGKTKGGRISRRTQIDRRTNYMN